MTTAGTTYRPEVRYIATFAAAHAANDFLPHDPEIYSSPSRICVCVYLGMFLRHELTSHPAALVCLYIQPLQA